MTLTIPPTEILDQALCAQTAPEAFFPETGENADAAKAICQRCPIAQRCLEWSLETGERHGIWGGLAPKERQRLLRQRRAA